MNNISNIKINGITYAVKDAEAREALENITVDESIIDEKLNNFLSIENGTGTLSIQTKEWVGDEDEEPRKSSAEGLGSVALGLDAYANGKASIALGKLTAAPVSYSTALGLRTTALGNRATALGSSTQSAYHEIGIKETATVDEIISAWLENNHAFSIAAKDALVYGRDCLALGIASRANGDKSIAYGSGATANGAGVTAIKDWSSANGVSTYNVFDVISNITMNHDPEDLYNNWLASKFNLAFENYSFTQGRDCLALGKFSQAFGLNNVAKGDHSTVFGADNLAGRLSFVGGSNNNVLGDFSAAFGSNNTINGNYSFIAGTNNESPLRDSFIVGRDNIAGGEYNGILGSSNTIGSSNNLSYVIGFGNTINAPYTLVIGLGLIANKSGTYIGQYNIDSSDENLQFVIGKGASINSRANLMEYRKTKDTLDIYATDVKFTKPDGTIVSVYDLLDRINTLENIINAQ